MSKLRKIKFKEFIKLQRGFDLPKKEMVDGPYPVMGSTSIIGHHNEYKQKPPGVITGRSGSLGKLQYINKKYWPHNTSLWIKDFKGNFPKYIYYFLHSIDFENFNAGVGVPTLNRNHLDNYDIETHEIDDQKKIATILSNYDDLIVNNTKRIQLLERMAKLIYDEWFVMFKFPGHENIKMVDSELGKIPEGWEVKRVAEICGTVMRGVTPKYEDGSRRFIINQKVNRGNYLDYQYLKELKKDLDVPKEKFAVNGDVLINSLGEGTIGRVHYYNGQSSIYAVDQHMSICRSENEKQTIYLYFYLSSDKGQKWITSVKTGGTNMTMLNISTLRDCNLLLPPKGILNAFYSQIKIVFNLRSKLDVVNQNLRKTRDALLPELISGQVDVSDLDIKIPEVEA